MNGKIKNRTIALLAGAAALCLTGGLILGRPVAEHASAADEYLAFADVGASSAAIAEDAVLGLTANGATATVEGTVTAGNTLFSSYATGATYTLTVGEAGTYQVAAAIHAEEGKHLTIGGEEADLTGKSGNVVISKDVAASGDSVTVTYDGELCAVFAAAQGSKVLLSAEYTPGQVIQYGALLEDQLENATGHYSDGTSEELTINYDKINGGTGVDVNFTTVDVSGTVEGTDLTVTRYLTTMPDDLIYFINCGSYTTPDSVFPEPGTVDGYYSYNRTVFDYYGESLLNYGTPDRTTTQGGEWGIYTAHGHNAPGDATFPYNTIVWTGNDYNFHEMGYMLSGLTAGKTYRIWLGTLSHWHGRTVNITFNGNAIAGQETLIIASSKGYTVFEDIAPDANGKVDIHMTQVGSENEPTLCFIAVQEMTTEVAAAPAAPVGPSLVGMEDTSITLTGNVTAGAKLQIYNAEKPYEVIYEEIVDGDAIGADGSYTLDWGEKLSVSQFRVVQVTSGGASDTLLVTVTDIQNFKMEVETQGYSTTGVTIRVQAEASSGIASWSYRLGEYGTETVVPLDRPFKLDIGFTVTENGDWYVVVTSGLGVTYSESLTVSTIDPDAPVISLTPDKAGWKKGAYNVALGITSVAPVEEYALYQNGKAVDTGTAAPSSIAIKTAGEYTVYVKTAAGRTATKTVIISDTPVSAVVRSTRINARNLRYSFSDSPDYVVRSVEAYMLGDRLSKVTVSGDNTMDVFEEGTYVAIVTALNGTVEMFSIDVTRDDFKKGGAVIGNAAGGGNANAVAIGVGVGVGGVVIAAGAVILTFMLTKKKKS